MSKLLKEIQERQERMYKLIDELYAQDDMNKMLQVVQQLEREAGELETVCVAFQEEADKKANITKRNRFEVVLTPAQRQRVMKETGVAMTTVWIEDQTGGRNAAMPATDPADIEREALRQARAMKTDEPARAAREKQIANAISEIEAGGPLYADAVAKMKQDPRVMKILDGMTKKPKP